MKVKAIRIFFLAAAILTFSACFGVYIDIQDHVAYPAQRFAEARAKIAGIEKHDPQRTQSPSSLQLLIYAGDDRQLIAVGIPFWIVDRMDDHDQIGMHHPAERVGRYLDLEHLRPRDLRRFGRGLVAEIEDHKEDTHILIWLE